jgi:hypothetical protein
MSRAAKTIATSWVLAMLACSGQGPAEKVAALRARYGATLNGFVVRQEPAPPATDAAGVPLAATPPGIATAELVAPPPASSDIILDIVVRHDSREKLPGITLEVDLVDADKREKEHYRIWIDTSRLERGPGVQVSSVLEDVPYQEGDGFFVEVRPDVPAAERGLYREFAGGS